MTGEDTFENPNEMQWCQLRRQELKLEAPSLGPRIDMSEDWKGRATSCRRCVKV